MWKPIALCVKMFYNKKNINIFHIQCMKIFITSNMVNLVKKKTSHILFNMETPKVLSAWLPESIIMFYRHISLFNCRCSSYHNTSYLGYNTHDCDSKVVLVSYHYIYLFLFSHSLRKTSLISLFISRLLASMCSVSHKSITC